MIKALLNGPDDEWVTLIGKYILNMGAVEFATRLLISIHDGNDSSPNMNSDLPSRLGFLRNRFPNIDSDRHSWAMNVFSVASRHVGFRNILAHSPIMIIEHEDGSRRILGVLSLTPKDPTNVGQLVYFEELRGRVDESAQLGSKFLEMQADFK